MSISAIGCRTPRRWPTRVNSARSRCSAARSAGAGWTEVLFRDAETEHYWQVVAAGRFGAVQVGDVDAALEHLIEGQKRQGIDQAAVRQPMGHGEQQRVGDEVARLP